MKTSVFPFRVACPGRRGLGALGAALAVSALGASGCGMFSKPPTVPPPAAVASGGGLVLEMHLPRREAVIGEALPVRLVARNTTDRDMVIRTDSGVLAHVTVLQRTDIGWEQVKRYPEQAVMIARSWILKARGAHEFSLTLPVTQEWPTGEPLQLAGELNGRPGVRPVASVRIRPAR